MSTNSMSTKCIGRDTNLKAAGLAALVLAVGLWPAAHAQAGSECGQGELLEIGLGTEPEKDTVGYACVDRTAETTGALPSGADRSWVIGSVGAETGDDEYDSVGYVVSDDVASGYAASPPR